MKRTLRELKFISKKIKEAIGLSQENTLNMQIQL